jgi:hypothetical protein
MLLKDIVTNGISYSVAMVSQDEDLTRDLQQRLVLWAYNPGPVDGDWGSKTQSAYASWATNNQFKPDEISSQAAARLLSAPPIPPIVIPPAITPPSSGNPPTTGTPPAQGNPPGTPPVATPPVVTPPVVAPPVVTPPAPVTPPVVTPPAPALLTLQTIAAGTSNYGLTAIRGNQSLVKELQTRLTALGQTPGIIDGLWGSKTEAAYAAWAKSKALPTDSLTPQAAKLLLPQPKVEPPVVPSSLKAIADGTTNVSIDAVYLNNTLVREIQTRLTAVGQKPGTIDGLWGFTSQDAYIAWATANKLPTNSITPQAAKLLLPQPKVDLPPAAPVLPANLPAIVTSAKPLSFTDAAISTTLVKEIQTRLTAYSAYSGAIDGKWTPLLQTAYITWATSNGFPTDSITPNAAKLLQAAPPKIDPVVIVKPTPPDSLLWAPDSEPAPDNLRAVRAGKYRWSVNQVKASTGLTKELQQSLNAMGHQPGIEDGQWGGKTQTAYSTFANKFDTLSFDASNISLSPRGAKLLLEPEIPKIPVPEKPAKLTDQDYQAVAKMIGCDEATVRAVTEVEAAGSGFFADGRSKILFEAHWFGDLTGGIYDDIAPSISSPVWNRSLYIGGVAEWDRLYRAVNLNRAAALKSASWGLGQIMGFNHGVAGYSNVEDFVKDMHLSEGKQLIAMFNFIRNADLANALVKRNWAAFARGYNGESYRINEYDVRLAESYAYWKQYLASVVKK